MQAGTDFIPFQGPKMHELAKDDAVANVGHIINTASSRNGESVCVPTHTVEISSETPPQQNQIFSNVDE